MNGSHLRLLICALFCVSTACASSQTTDEASSDESSAQSGLQQESDEEAAPTPEASDEEDAGEAERRKAMAGEVENKTTLGTLGDSDIEIDKEAIESADLDKAFAQADGVETSGAEAPGTTRPKVEVSVSLAEVVISDDEKLDATSTRAMLERRVGDLDQCAQRAADSGAIEGSLDGTLVLKLSVSTPGRIGDIEVEDSEVPGAIETCAKRRVRRVRLRRPSAPVEVTATYRFRVMRPEAVEPRE